MFCGGFKSDMEGTKAQFLEQECRSRGQGFIRFDYSGHGASDGAFEDGTIGLWKDDALAILDELTQGAVILAGSSMGGWIALLLARERPARIKGIIGIAAAPDFTKDIYESDFDNKMKETLAKDGFIDIPSEYSEQPYRISKALIEDGARHCLLDRPLALDMPIRLLQGMKDQDVPWQKAYRIKNALLDESRAEVILVESGDHRLSRPEDLVLLAQQVQDLSL
ncbi:MAG: alpha/beta hydrolase [Alphaproteobacteria bacterium CG_4_9_14_3_um_filter_47_13]|nr:MAG: alpha/beta hydrolase [Alphaproteobacteria bacterium CG_4_9_14_3_um_filter_47_13]